MLEDSASMQLLSRYGYLAVLAGTMLEGETVVLVAGFLAHQGYLALPWIMICAVIGSCASDQGLFFLSRFRGRRFLSRFPQAEARVKAMAERMRAKPGALSALALFFRFLYGLRNIAPIFLGMSSIPTLRFMLLNAVGAVLWAVSFSLLGYIFARTLEAFMGRLAHYEIYFVAGLIVTGCAWALFRRWRHAGTPSKTRENTD